VRILYVYFFPKRDQNRRRNYGDHRSGGSTHGNRPNRGPKPGPDRGSGPIPDDQLPRMMSTPQRTHPRPIHHCPRPPHRRVEIREPSEIRDRSRTRSQERARTKTQGVSQMIGFI
jgi:hypothetical protein